MALCAVHLAVIDGDTGSARAALEKGESRMMLSDAMEARFLVWKVSADPSLLEGAHRMLCELRDHAPEEYRETMIENVPLHRNIVRAWEETEDP